MSFKQILQNKSGVSLMELIVSIGIILVLMMGIYNLISFSMKITADNKTYVEATEIVNQKMENIRNMPYDDVGTLTGSPVGTISEYETIVRGAEYQIHTMLMFFDDPYDGTISDTDTIITDYKIATIEISWQGRFSEKKITIFSKIIPNTEETLSGYGLLKLFVIDSNGARVPNANIHIENASSGLNVDLVTNLSGELAYPVLPGLENYKIIVTKTNYSTERTYAKGELVNGIANTNPTKPHLSIFDGVKTEESFNIDQLATLNIQVFSNNQPASWLVNTISADAFNENVNFSIDSSDNLYFTWQKKDDSSSQVLIQKYNDSGTKQWASPFGVELTNYQENPDIETDANGNSYIVWQDNSINLKAISYKKNNLVFAKKEKNKIELISDLNYYKHPVEIIKNNFAFDKNPFNTKKQKIFKILEKFKTTTVQAATQSIIFVGSSGQTTGNNELITIPLPASVQEDDFLLAYIHHDTSNDGPMEAPTGWNILNDNLDPSGSSSDSRGNIFWKFAGNSEPSSYTFYTRETCFWFCSYYDTRKAGQIRAYRNVDPDNPFDNSLVFSTTERNNQLHDTPSHSVTNDGSMLVCGWGTDSASLGNSTPIFPVNFQNTLNNFANSASVATADKSVNISNSMEVLAKYNANTSVGTASINWSLVLKPIINLDELTFSVNGDQISSSLSPQTNLYLGGSFVASKNTLSSTNITSLTLTESGTIDEDNDLENIKLFYELDTSAPYDCASEIYAGSETQVGTTTNFSSGVVSFNSVGIAVNSSQSACFYVVLDILNSAIKDSSIKISFNPSSDVTINPSGNVLPNATISPAGETNILKDTELAQVHYRWQDDDQSEELGTWLANADSPIQFKKETPLRLRFEISNNGNLTSNAINYRLEYGKNISTCSDIASWTALPSDNSRDWKITDSIYLVNSSPSQNIANGLIDEKLSFVAGEILDTSNLSSGIALADDEFTELLYSVEATSLVDDSIYCFRLTNNGDTNKFNYDVYPQINVVGDYNIYIKKLDNTGSTVWTSKRINIDTSNADQLNPRLAYTKNIGSTATTSIVWEDKRNINSDIYLQIFKEDGTRFFANDIRVTSSSTDEYEAEIIINNLDEIIVVWTENNGVKENIYAQKFNQTGIAQWSSIKSLAENTSNNYQAKIKTKDNYFYLTWTEDDLLSKQVKLAKFDNDGNKIWQKDANLESHDANQEYSDLFIKDNDLIVSWTDNRYLNKDVFAQKYDLDGNPQWTKDLKLNVVMSNSDQEKSKVIINSANRYFATWQSDENGKMDIYAKEFIDPAINSPAVNVPIIITGTKKIGENPIILKYSQEHLSDSSGEIIIPLEWDSPGYTFTIGSSSSLNIVSSSKTIPLEIKPAENNNIILYVD